MSFHYVWINIDKKQSFSFLDPAFQHPGHARSSPSHTAKMNPKNEGTDPTIKNIKGPEQQQLKQIKFPTFVLRLYKKQNRIWPGDI